MRKLPKFLLLSFILHVLVMVFTSIEWEKSEKEKKDRGSKVEVVQLSPQDVERIKRQIVETEKVKKSEKAAKDAFLGEQTQVVDRQTHAANGRTFQSGKGKSATPSETKGGVKLSNLGVSMNLKPQGHLRPEQRATSSDYFNKDVREGAQTMLNTKEFAYYSFYQRVRRQLEQYWEPGLRERLKKMFDRGRQLASDREHSTKIYVVMDSTGNITRVKVAGTSGLSELDQSAIDAFNRAGPFPNPPKGMVDRDGTITVEWEFILKT